MNSRRWLTAVIVALVGVLIYYIAINTEWREITVPMPYKGEAATNPHYAMRQFMRELGTEVHVEKSLLSMPPTDAAMMLSDWHWDLIDDRRRKIEAWVEAGGRLIVDTSLIGNNESFEQWTGFKQDYPEEDEENEEEEEDQSLTEEIEAQYNSLRCKDLIAKEGLANRYRHQYEVCSTNHFGWLVSSRTPLWLLSDENGHQVVRVAIGKGSVTLTNVTPFTNRIFRNGDHAALIVALTQLHTKDKVWLVTESAHANILILAWRYGAPVIIVLAIFIIAALWRNAMRFGPLAAPLDAPRRSLAELIRGSGWFYERQGEAKLLDAAIERALYETASKHIRGYAQLSPKKRAAALAAATGHDVEQLQSALQLLALPASANKLHLRRERRRASALLETTRRVLASKKRHLTITTSDTLSDSNSEVKHAS
jgi:hypothetical protein